MSHICRRTVLGSELLCKKSQVHGFLGDEQILIKSLSEIEYVCESNGIGKLL
jgi:hypothetical protein